MNCKSKTEQCMLTQATVELQWGKSEYEKVKVNRNLVTVNFFKTFLYSLEQSKSYPYIS